MICTMLWSWQVRVDGPSDRAVQTFRELARLAHEVPSDFCSSPWGTSVDEGLTTLPHFSGAMHALGATLRPQRKSESATFCFAKASVLMCGRHTCNLVINVFGLSARLTCFRGTTGRPWGTTVRLDVRPPLSNCFGQGSFDLVVDEAPLEVKPYRHQAKSIVNGRMKSPLQTCSYPCHFFIIS